MSTPATVGTEPSTRPASPSRFITAMHAARPVQVFHVLRARGRQLDQVGRAVGHFVESLELELDLSLVGDGHQVQHRVGGAAQSRVDGERVAEAGLGDERRAVQPLRTTSTAAAPVCRARISRAENGAGMVASPGRVRPRVSMTQPIELAVNRPAHEPQVGQTRVLEVAQLVLGRHVALEVLAHALEDLGQADLARPGSRRPAWGRRRPAPRGCPAAPPP